MDEKTVYDISITPKSGLQTALVGKLAILDREFGVLEAELSPVASITESMSMRRWPTLPAMGQVQRGRTPWSPPSRRPG